MQNKKLILFLILLIIPNFSNANTIQLSCEYEFGKGEVIINEESNKITFGQMVYSKKLKIDHRFIAFKKLKRKIKIL